VEGGSNDRHVVVKREIEGERERTLGFTGEGRKDGVRGRVRRRQSVDYTA
jgi:hypothetical protein